MGGAGGPGEPGEPGERCQLPLPSEVPNPSSRSQRGSRPEAAKTSLPPRVPDHGGMKLVITSVAGSGTVILSCDSAKKMNEVIGCLKHRMLFMIKEGGVRILGDAWLQIQRQLKIPLFAMITCAAMTFPVTREEQLSPLFRQSGAFCLASSFILQELMMINPISIQVGARYQCSLSYMDRETLSPIVLKPSLDASLEVSGIHLRLELLEHPGMVRLSCDTPEDMRIVRERIIVKVEANQLDVGAAKMYLDGSFVILEKRFLENIALLNSPLNVHSRVRTFKLWSAAPDLLVELEPVVVSLGAGAAAGLSSGAALMQRFLPPMQESGAPFAWA